MAKKLYKLFLLFTICTFQINLNAQGYEQLIKYMTGSFNSSAQAYVDSNYYDINLEMVPIWTNDKYAKWFYVEQAVSKKKDKPYRQRIYKVTQTGSNTFESAVYLLPKPEKFIGAYKNATERFKKLKPKKITEKEGCTIKLVYNGNYYYGKTDDKTCPSKLRGSSYATSEVKIFEDRLESWDRGFNEKDEHVWGATNGAYIFHKKNKTNLKNMEYPITRQDNVVDDYFGTKIKDPYRWLENDKSLETRNWINQQNELTQSYIGQFSNHKKIKTRLTELYDFENVFSPWSEAGNTFTFKKQGLENQKSLFIKEKGKTDFNLLIDGNKLSEDGTVSIATVSASKDGKYLAYTLSEGGSDWQTAKVIDLETYKVLEDELNWIKFSRINWYKNGFFYSRFQKPDGSALSEQNQFQSIYYHTIGSKQNEDRLIFEDKKNPEIGYGLHVSDDEQHFFMYAWKGTSGGNLYHKKASLDAKPFKLIYNNWDYYHWVMDVKNDIALIQTNQNAPFNKIIKYNLKTYQEGSDFISEKDYLLEEFLVSKDKYVVSYLKDVASEVFVLDKNGKELNKIKLPTKGIVQEFSSNKNQEEIYYKFVSYINPPTIFQHNTNTSKTKIYQKSNVDFDSDNFVSIQKFYKSKDGTKIPIMITHKKNIKLDGNNPTMLYAYGGFNIGIKPAFNANNMVFMEQGGIYAVANLRGGNEYGEDWHKAGMLDKKQNVFDDFYAAAEFLISEKYTNKNKLAIMGRSNGGLLIGASLCQRPDLFKVAIPVVGVMDMLRYQKFTIGHAWTVEYGSSENENDFKNLIKYSPLHNLKPNHYPATLVLTADRDDRVVPAHSFKFISELQKNQIGKQPNLIRIDNKAGHGIGKSTSQNIEENADLWTFVFQHLGITYK